MYFVPRGKLYIYIFFFEGDSLFCASHGVRKGGDKTGERVYFGGVGAPVSFLPEANRALRWRLGCCPGSPAG